MALSGEFSKYPVSGLGLYCTWSAKQNARGNYSDVTLNVYLNYYQIEVGSRNNSTISINGVSETYTAPAITDYSSGYKRKLFKSKTVRVQHNSDGTKSILLSASWSFWGVYNGIQVSTITASATVALDKIDRTAPSVSSSISNVTVSGFTVTATSSATADLWQYSLGQGWKNFSTKTGTTASHTFTGLSPHTNYRVTIRARKSSNHVYGQAQTRYIKTLGGAQLNSVSEVLADDQTVRIKLNTTVYQASFSNTLVLKIGGSTILTFSNLKWPVGTADRTITLSAAQRSTLLRAIKSTASAGANFELLTYNGQALVGQASIRKAMIRTRHAVSGPIVKGFTLDDGNTKTKSLLNKKNHFIQHHSNLIVKPVAAEARNEASIVQYTATCNGRSEWNILGGPLELGGILRAGKTTVELRVTDSRGYSNSISKEIIVLEYTQPSCNRITLRRTNDIEAEIQLILSGKISSIKIDGQEKNRLVSASYWTKRTDEKEWGNSTSILSQMKKSGINFTYENYELCTLDANHSYDFAIFLQDEVNHNWYYFVIPKGTPLLSLRKDKVGINTPEPQATLDVQGDIKSSGKVNTSLYEINGKPVLNNPSNQLFIGKPDNLYTYINSVRYGGFSASRDNYLTLGRSDYRWMTLWVVSGVVQSSGRQDKEKIRPLRRRLQLGAKTSDAEPVLEDRNPDYCFEEDIYELLDKIAEGLCTFQYKDQMGGEAKQLGVLADDLSDLPAYPFIGTKELIQDEVDGETKEREVYGLNPLPVAMLAISGYRKQKEEIKGLEERIKELERKTKWML